MSDPLSDREFSVPSSGLPLAEPDGPRDSEPTFDSPSESAAPEATEDPPRRSRRGRRGGRRRRRRGREGGEDSGALALGAPEPGEPPAEGLPLEAEDDVDAGAESAAEEGEDAPANGDGDGEGDGAPRKRRRGRRGGRRRRRSSERGEGESRAPARAATASADDDEERDEEPSARRSESNDGRRTRKRGSRGGRRKQRKPGGAVSIEIIPGDDDELPELADLPEDAVLVNDSKARSQRRRNKDEDEDDDDDDEREPPRRAEPHKKRVILVNARDPEEKRVAVTEEGRIVDLQMTVKKHVSYVNDIYRGRVVNIESAIGAAFVDFGEGRNGFLHASDVLPSYGEADWSLEKLLSTPVADGGGAVAAAWTDEKEARAEELEGAEDAEGEPIEAAAEAEDSDEDEEEEEPRARARGRRNRTARHRTRSRLPIDKLLKKGQMVAVQITKDAIGDKGPTLTTYVSIPGRYLVLMPSLERTGVSRKIDDERERRRLKRILQSLDIPEGMGVIVRTAGIGRTKTEIKRDLEYLLLAWEDFSKRLRSGRNPAPLYQESDVAIRTMRDLFTPETESVIVDDTEVYNRMVEFTKRLMPEHLDRVKQHDGARPLFHGHGVEQDFERIFARRVELPSGGSIVIEQTEALVAIDVNSGRTREEGAEFEDIALKTNLEAVPEIARQIRLRDLGGIIVLDYIDMMRSNSRKAVERATREALKADRARAKIGRISQFGLLELTRQRLGPGLSKLVYDTCPRCRGSGRRRNASSRAQAILRRLAAALALKGYTTVEVRTHPDVVEYLNRELKAEMTQLQEQSGREIRLQSVPEQVEDSVLHYLRADGREVRPGGRRRR